MRPPEGSVCPQKRKGGAMLDRLYIIIPAYNESANIRRTVEEWYPVVERHHGGGTSRLVVIDDGSRDQTLEILRDCAKTKPLLLPLTKENGGHGAAVLYGYHYALKEGADYVFQTDSDGQTVPEEFEAFWRRRKNYDMVIGWRRERQDGFGRILVTRVLKAVVLLCFQVNIADVNTPYRLMKASTLKKYIGLIPKNFNLSNVLLCVIFVKKKCRVKFIPITFRKRQGGVNSINMKKITAIGIRALKDFARLSLRWQR